MLLLAACGQENEENANIYQVYYVSNSETKVEVHAHEMLAVAPVSLLIGAFMIIIGRPLSVFLSLAPIRKITLRSKCFISWVGLRGAVPIIFATYPVVAEVEGASQIFNIVFFVTLLSLLIQGTTVIKSAHLLNLVDKNAGEDEHFGVELDEQLPTTLQTLRLTERHLATGDTLRDIPLPKDSLVMLVKRGNSYMVPNGRLQLRKNDALLIISENQDTGKPSSLQAQK